MRLTKKVGAPAPSSTFEDALNLLAGHEAVGRLLCEEPVGTLQAILHFEYLVRLDFVSRRVRDVSLKQLRRFVGKTVTVFVLEEPVRRLNVREINGARVES